MATQHTRLYTRPVIAMLTCVFASSCASLICLTALGYEVYQLTNREFDLGLLGLFEFAPSFLLLLLTGSIADRVDRARISAWSTAFQAFNGVALALYIGSGPTEVWPIFALITSFGIGRAFLAPANRALPADIVPPDQLPWLTPRRSATWQIAVIIGPVLAGFLRTIDPAAPYVAMTVLLVIGAVAMFLVRPGDMRYGITAVTIEPGDPSVEPAVAHDVAPPQRNALREAVEGLRFIRRSPVLLGAISLDLFGVLFAGSVALLPAIARDRLQVDVVGLGWLRAAGGIGAAAVTLAIAWRPVRRRVGRVLLVVVAIFGVFTIVLGVTRSFVVAFVAMAVLSGADAVSVFIRSTLVPLVAPPDKRGRVLAVESVFIGASNELGAFESGVAGQLLGASGAVVLGGAATLVIAGTYWVAFPALRDVDRFPGTER